MAELTPSPFPVRVGAIDVGSNAIRLLAVEFTDPETWLELESKRTPVRLGHSSFLTGRLDEQLMTGAVEAMATSHSGTSSPSRARNLSRCETTPTRQSASWPATAP